MPGALLDSHALYWLVTSPEVLSDEAVLSIAVSQAAAALYVSPITAWELTIASRKGADRGSPDLGPTSPSSWFSAAVKATGAKVVPIRQRIACAAASVVLDTGHKDPGDCYLVATARVRSVPLITRDAVILAMAARGYLAAVAC